MTDKPLVNRNRFYDRLEDMRNAVKVGAVFSRDNRGYRSRQSRLKIATIAAKDRSYVNTLTVSNAFQRRALER
jgi:hypothetical protein